MVSSELAREIHRLIDVLEGDAKPLFSLLVAASDVQERIDEIVTSYTEGTDKVKATVFSEVHTAYAQASRLFHGRSIKGVWLASEALIAALNRFSRFGGADSVTADLAQTVRVYESQLDEYVAQPAMQRAPNFLRLSTELLAKLKLFRHTVESLLPLIAPSLQLEQDDETLTIQLHDWHDLPSIIEKLRALQAVFDELQDILAGVGEPTKFRVARMETGSVVLTVIASKLGISALSRILTNLGGYLYRNYTTEGKLDQGVQFSAQAIERALKLRKDLVKNGIPVDGMDEALASSGVYLAQQVAILIGNSSKVRVGDRELKRTEPFLEAFSPAREIPLIEGPRLLPKKRNSEPPKLTNDSTELPSK